LEGRGAWVEEGRRFWQSKGGRRGRVHGLTRRVVKEDALLTERIKVIAITLTQRVGKERHIAPPTGSVRESREQKEKRNPQP